MYVDGGSSSEILYEHFFNRWPLGKILLLVKIGDEEHSTSAWMNFMVLRQNGYTTEQLDHSTRMHNGLRTKSAAARNQPSYRRKDPEGQKELCCLLRRNLDIFAWNPADMIGVLRYIAEHRLNIREGCLPVRQKKRGQAHERNKAIY
ncbi:hypothetical protein Tco_0469239 [Tanacetum coccineum]